MTKIAQGREGEARIEAWRTKIDVPV
jgi:hypothetical protein